MVYDEGLHPLVKTRLDCSTPGLCRPRIYVRDQIPLEKAKTKRKRKQPRAARQKQPLMHLSSGMIAGKKKQPPTRFSPQFLAGGTTMETSCRMTNLHPLPFAVVPATAAPLVLRCAEQCPTHT